MPSAICPGTLGPFGNVYKNGMIFPKAGDFVQFHEHDFDHVLTVMKGALDVRCQYPSGREWRGTVWSMEASVREGGPLFGSSPQEVAEAFYSNAHVNFFLVPAGIKHYLLAREDLTVGVCTFAIRDGEGKVVASYPVPA